MGEVVTVYDMCHDTLEIVKEMQEAIVRIEKSIVQAHQGDSLCPECRVLHHQDSERVDHR